MLPAFYDDHDVQFWIPDAEFSGWKILTEVRASYFKDNEIIDREKYIIHGGFSWQNGKPGRLTAQYVYDMRTLIGKIRSGSAETETVSSFEKFLDTNFKYGMVTIAWKKEAAA